MGPDEFPDPRGEVPPEPVRAEPGEQPRQYTPPRWHAVSAVVDAALELPPEQRAAYVAQACAGDAELRAEVEQLLRACEQAERSDRFLAEPAGAFAEPVIADLGARAAAAEANVPAALAAALSGRFAVERKLGRGGMATVFLARDLKHGRSVAVKVLRPELATALGPERFLREISVAAGLTHPNIVPLFDSGAGDQAGAPGDGLLYYVMPYVEGESLRDRLRREMQLPLDDALQIVRDVAAALDHAHAHDVVHRDIKPENILLEGGRAMVADFGLARAISAAGGDRLTQTGVAVGTPSYMSPEQATAEPRIDGRSDVYSLACVVYEMLAGEPPFTGPNAQAVIAKRLVMPPPQLSLVRDAVPAAVDRVLARAMARVSADRFATAGEFVAALSEALGQGSLRAETPPPSAASTPERLASALRSRPLWATLVTVAVFVTAITGVWGARRARAPSTPLSPDLVAVLPFTVRGSDQVAYLGEGIVDLLSVTLDGAGDLRTADSRAVLALSSHQGIEGHSPERARSIARRLGAGRYVHGEIVEVAGRLRLTGALYDAGRDAGPRRRASVEGGVAGWFQLVDRLGAELLAGEISGTVRPLAEAVTPSPAALKAYLEGEAELRAGEVDSAVAAFERAVRADSEFSLARYRMAYAYSFTPHGATPFPVLARSAVRHSARLSARGRMAAEAFRLKAEGHARDAERLYRQILSEHPEDVEAWFLLGTLLVNHAPRQGRSIDEARAPLVRALSYQSDHESAGIFLAWMEARLGRSKEAASLWRRQLELRPREFSGAHLRALLAFSDDEPTAQDRAVAELRSASEDMRFWSAWQVAEFTDNMRAAERLAQLMTEPSYASSERAEGYGILAHVRVRRGQWRAARATLDSAEALDVDEGRRVRGHLSLVLLLPVSTADLREARRLVDEWRPSGVIPGLRRLYLLGMLAGRLGDDAGVDLAVGQLERNARALAAAGDSLEGESSDRLAARARDLSLAVQAHRAWTHGRPAEALATLDRTDPEDRWDPVTWSLFAAGSAERFLRAEALGALGRDREAIRWYETLGPAASAEIVYLPVRHLRVAELYERLGRPDSAAAHYARFAELWKDGEPEVRPLVDSATARAMRLRGGR